MLHSDELLVDPWVNTEIELLLSHEGEVVYQLRHFGVELIDPLLVFHLKEILKFFLNVSAKGVRLFNHILDFLF